MTPTPMTHEEALEIAGLYALAALTPDEKASVDAHLATCTQDHSEFADLGGVAPALASLAEPVDAPAALKERVLAAYRAEVGTSRDAAVSAAPPAASATALAKPWAIEADAEPRPRSLRAPNWMGWAAAEIAILLLALLSVVGLDLRQQADQANQRADQMAQAVAALAAPGSQVAILQGSGTAAGVSGFAAFPASGTGYMVMTDVPAAPAGMTYQGWYIVDGNPTSAGTMTAGSDGKLIAGGLLPLPGTDVVAVTLEPTGGSDQPTSQPIIVGDVTTRT